MDRFIEIQKVSKLLRIDFLKSNMDRFIEKSNKCENQQKNF